jgi:hypothetical protein
MLRRRHAPGEAAPLSANVVSSLCAQSRRASMHGRPPAPGAWVPPSKTQGPPAQAFSADAGFESQISNPRATQEHRRWRRALWLRSRGRGCSVRLLRPPSRRADALGRPSVSVFDPDGAITVKIVQPARMLPKRPTSGPLMHARAVGFQPLLVHSGVKRWALQDRTFRHLLRLHLRRARRTRLLPCIDSLSIAHKKKKSPHPALQTRCDGFNIDSPS